MKRLALIGALAVLACVAAVASAAPGRALQAGDPHGLVPARGQPQAHGGGGSPDLIWHGGEIITSAAVTAVLSGTSWGDASFVADKISGLDSFYSGVSRSAYIDTNTEYTGTNGQVGNRVSYAGHVVDLSPGPKHAPKVSQVLDEVGKMI